MSFPVLITYSNYGYIDFAKNLILNLARVLKKHKLHFYCLDKQTYDELSKQPHGFLTLELFEQNVSSDFESYDTDKYNKLTHTKTSVLRRALAAYPFIHFIDCDVVCMREPSLAHYERYKNFDIVFQYDWYFENNIPTEFFGIYQCTGNTSFRRTPQTMKLLDLWDYTQSANTKYNDQVCLKLLLKNSGIKDIRDFKVAKLWVYPPEEYTNGSWQGLRTKIYFFHANHVVGKEDKINLLKKVGYWLL